MLLFQSSNLSCSRSQESESSVQSPPKKPSKNSNNLDVRQTAAKTLELMDKFVNSEAESREDYFCKHICAEMKKFKFDESYDNFASKIYSALTEIKKEERIMSARRNYVLPISPYNFSPIQHTPSSPTQHTPSSPFKHTPSSPFKRTPSSPFKRTPSFRHTPSPYQYTPSPTQHTPSPYQYTPSPTQHTPSLTQHTPSPIQHIPSPIQHIPSPIQHTPSVYNFPMLTSTPKKFDFSRKAKKIEIQSIVTVPAPLQVQSQNQQDILAEAMSAIFE